MIRLLLHHILIKPDKVEDIDNVVRSARAAGIEVKLDKREQKAVEYGTVVQVGPIAFIAFGLSPDILKEGQRISFAKYAGKEIKYKDETYLLINDEDCLLEIEE